MCKQPRIDLKKLAKHNSIKKISPVNTRVVMVYVTGHHLINLYKGEKIMNTSSSNTAAVPQAKEALNKFKYEVASEIGVPLKQGYNGDLTSAQAGYVGGYMVNNVSPERHKEFTRMQGMVNMRPIVVRYTYAVAFG